MLCSGQYVYVTILLLAVVGCSLGLGFCLGLGLQFSYLWKQAHWQLQLSVNITPQHALYIQRFCTSNVQIGEKSTPEDCLSIVSYSNSTGVIKMYIIYPTWSNTVWPGHFSYECLFFWNSIPISRLYAWSAAYNIVITIAREYTSWNTWILATADLV